MYVVLGVNDYESEGKIRNSSSTLRAYIKSILKTGVD